MLNRFARLTFCAAILLATSLPATAAELEKIYDAELQPLLVHVNKLQDAMDYLGTPLSAQAKADLAKAAKSKNEGTALDLIQDTLDPLCLIKVHINPESRVKVDPGPAPHQLMQGGWTQFLVKVHNEAGVTAQLQGSSPQGLPVNAKRPGLAPPEKVRDRWMDMMMYDGRPLNRTLNGTKLEYRIIQIYSRDAGKRSAVVAFDVGQGTQDIGFRNDVTLTFDAASATPITFKVRDEAGKPTTAAFTIVDKAGRVYPSQAKRLEPDFAFHPQVYRGDGEGIALPPGEYTINVQRGPEYFKQSKKIEVGSAPQSVAFDLKRWIDPSDRGYWSGDHHIHAAGCAHYQDPSEGVHADAMAKHIIGEDLKVGANLTWGPCFDYQKQFFTGKDDNASQYPYILRYDVEVSGFGSHRSGHLVLLRLKEQMYPGGDSSSHWPTLCLNTLKWAKKQGAIVGPAHSGWGLQINSATLPSYEIPPMNHIGAMEYIVDVTHKVPGPDGELVNAVDFMSTVDTPYNWELNCWYHSLNAGYRTRISGETDFPCIYGERVGLGRSYVKLDGNLTYDEWCLGIQKGTNYVGDGRSHLIDFKVNNVLMGEGDSEVRLNSPGTVDVTVDVAAYLPNEPDPKLDPYPDGDLSKGFGNTIKPFWHIERARIGNSRNVKVELVVNAYPVAEKIIKADGKIRQVKFDNVKIDKSSWVTMRIAYTSHTNPIWVMVGDKPVREKRSIQWCLDALEQLWKEKERVIAQPEMDDAIAAYNYARKVYRQRLAEAGN